MFRKRTHTCELLKSVVAIMKIVVAIMNLSRHVLPVVTQQSYQRLLSSDYEAGWMSTCAAVSSDLVHVFLLKNLPYPAPHFLTKSLPIAMYDPCLSPFFSRKDKLAA